MNRKQALTDLLAQIEAGETPHHAPLRVAFGDENVAGPAYWARQAFQGDLNAAKALHEAVLPGWTMDQMNEWHDGAKGVGWGVSLLRLTEPRLRARHGDYKSSPARAWLIAILRALIAECEE